jgi:hypothetical protein
VGVRSASEEGREGSLGGFTLCREARERSLRRDFGGPDAVEVFLVLGLSTNVDDDVY